MATVADIIERAMRLCGQLGSGQSATAAEKADGLVALNAMLDDWNNDSLMCFAFQAETLTLANGTSSYTVGTSGDLNTTRPVEIVNAYIVQSNISYPVEVIDETRYAAIVDKTTTADWPDRLLFRPTIASSQATVIVWPVPNAARTLKLTTRVQVAAFAAATDTVTLPPGWVKAMAANLCVEIAPEFETVASAEVKAMAASSLARIKRANLKTRPRRMVTDLSYLFAPASHNITTDAP